MEIIKEQPDRKEPKEEAEKEDHFMHQWRNSKFYPFVMKIIDNEIDTPYLKETLAKLYAEGGQIDNDEVAVAAKVEYQTEARLLNIKEALK